MLFITEKFSFEYLETLSHTQTTIVATANLVWVESTH